MLPLESEFIYLSLLLFTRLTRILKTKEVEKSPFLVVFLDLNQIFCLFCLQWCGVSWIYLWHRKGHISQLIILLMFSCLKTSNSQVTFNNCCCCCFFSAYNFLINIFVSQGSFMDAKVSKRSTCSGSMGTLVNIKTSV